MDNCSVILFAVSLSVSGCASTVCQNPAVPPTPRPIELPRQEIFNWERATILVGMTREQAVEQIKLSGLAQFNGKYGITMPDEQMYQEEIWVLGAGNATGAAPGGGALVLYFEGDHLIRIVFGPLYASNLPVSR